MEVQETTGETTEQPPVETPEKPRRSRSRVLPMIGTEEKDKVDALLTAVLPKSPEPTAEDTERAVARVHEAIARDEEAEETEPLVMPEGLVTVQVRSHQVARVNAEQSATLIRLCEYDKQRPTSPATVQRYTDLMLTGEFGLNIGWLAWVGSRCYLVNMKHRLTACVEAAKKNAEVTFPCIIVETFHDNKREVDEIYRNQDRGKDRTAADFMRALDEDALGDMEHQAANRLASAACFIMTSFQNNSPTSARPGLQDILVRVKLGKVFRSVAGEYFDAIKEAKGDLKKALHRAPVVAVAVAIMEEQPDKGKSFFQRIARFDNLTAKSGEWWMATNVLAPGKYSSRENVRLTRAIAHAWNAYFDDKLIPDFKLPKGSEEKPIHLRGTSYTEKNPHVPAKLEEYRASIGSAPQPTKRAGYNRRTVETVRRIAKVMGVTVEGGDSPED